MQTFLSSCRYIKAYIQNFSQFGFCIGLLCITMWIANATQLIYVVNILGPELRIHTNVFFYFVVVVVAGGNSRHFYNKTFSADSHTESLYAPLILKNLFFVMTFRLFGLTAIVETTCDIGDPRVLNLIKDHPWPVYVNPVLLLIFYLYVGTQVRIWLDGPVSTICLLHLFLYLEWYKLL